MSFGYSIGDAVLLTRLAWSTVQNCRKACGIHHEITRETAGLHTVLQRLGKEISKPTSPINKPDEGYQRELHVLASGCKDILRKVNEKLNRYSSLSEKSNSARKIWQKVRFGNGEIADLESTQARLHFYVSKLSLLMQTVSIGSLGRVEQQMQDAGGELQGLRLAIDGISKHILADDRPESVLTTYSNDDKTVWRAFRRELIGEGFSSALIHRHKDVIKAYASELADRASIHNESVETPAQQEDVCSNDDVIADVLYAKELRGVARDAHPELDVNGVPCAQGEFAYSEALSLSPEEQEHQHTTAFIGTTVANIDRNSPASRLQDHEQGSVSTHMNYQDTQAWRNYKQTAFIVSKDKAALLVAHLAVRIAATDPKNESVGTSSAATSPALAPLKVHHVHHCERFPLLRSTLTCG